MRALNLTVNQLKINKLLVSIETGINPGRFSVPGSMYCLSPFSIPGDWYGFLISFRYLISDRVFRQSLIMVHHTSTSVWKHGLLGCFTVFHVTDVVQVVFMWL